MELTPKAQGYYFPAEWAPHRATWLSWPHKEASWPGKIDSIYRPYAEFVGHIARGERVHINVGDDAMRRSAERYLSEAGVDLSQVHFYPFPTNDAWCRDHGPAFLVHPDASLPKIILDWEYNAWGEKYPPYDLDNVIPTLIAQEYNIPVVYPGIVMEGGSVDFNGAGTVLTTTACLLNPNRNPFYTQSDIENFLVQYYGVEQVLWLGEGIEGDDTDGHIDDITRFIDENTVITVIEHNARSNNYKPLKENLRELHYMRLATGKQLNIVELPMPEPVVYEGTVLPASYANFYISNAAVIVPTYHSKWDEMALEILSDCFPDRKVVGIDSTDIIWGLGSFHCLSQQEPL